MKVSDIRKLRGRAILHYYKASLFQALETVYPEYKWYPWSFCQVSQGYWEDKKHQREFFDVVAQQLHIENLEDWERVNYLEVAKRGGSGLLHRVFQLYCYYYSSYYSSAVDQ